MSRGALIGNPVATWGVRLVLVLGRCVDDVGNGGLPALIRRDTVSWFGPNCVYTPVGSVDYSGDNDENAAVFRHRHTCAWFGRGFRGGHQGRVEEHAPLLRPVRQVGR